MKAEGRYEGLKRYGKKRGRREKERRGDRKTC
jgi:hypothetical protein